MDFPIRKPNRIPDFDYSTPGAYFLTICISDRKCILGKIVGGGDLDAPQMVLSHIGRVVQQNIEVSRQIPNIRVDKYVIMPNHVHLILFVDACGSGGTSRSPSPTNATVPRYVSCLKRFCHHALHSVIFQKSYHDHVIRNEADYLKIWNYIDTNPARWEKDCFYEQEDAR